MSKPNPSWSPSNRTGKIVGSRTIRFSFASAIAPSSNNDSNAPIPEWHTHNAEHTLALHLNYANHRWHDYWNNLSQNIS